jgi:hypothetical protein
VVLLPLIRRQQGKIAIVEFAALDLTGNLVTTGED